MNFENFATTVYPFVELQPFHRSYYRLLEAFAQGKVEKVNDEVLTRKKVVLLVIGQLSLLYILEICTDASY